MYADMGLERERAEQIARAVPLTGGHSLSSKAGDESKATAEQRRGVSEREEVGEHGQWSTLWL